MNNSTKFSTSYSHKPSLTAVKLAIPMMPTEEIQNEINKLDKIITALREDNNSVQVDYYVEKQHLLKNALRVRNQA